MSETASASIRDRDEQLVRQMAILVAFWSSMFLLASFALITYGDVLTSLFA